MERSAAVERLEPLELLERASILFERLERSPLPAARQAGAIERFERLERLKRLEPRQWMWGEAKWNGYFLGNRDLECQKIFNRVT